MFLSSGGRYIREILELPQGWQGPFKAQEGRCDYSRDTQQKRASSGVEGRTSWFFSSCTSKLGVPPELQRGPQGHGRGASGSSSLHERCEGPLGISLQLLPKTRSSSRFEARTSVFYPRADMDLRVPLGFPQGSQASSRVETCKSALLSSWKNIARLPVGWTCGMVVFS